MRLIVSSVVGVLCGLVSVLAQQSPAAAGQQPAFDAVSVKRFPPDAEFVFPRIQPLPNGFVAVNTELRGLIRFAYRLEDYELADQGPSLLRQRFDVSARFTGDQRAVGGLDTAVRRMTQRLLAERFRLATRQEERILDVYVLMKDGPGGGTGPGLRPSGRDCSKPEPSRLPGDVPLPCVVSLDMSTNEYTADGHPMRYLAETLSGLVDRPLVDRTGLDGAYEMRVKIDLLPPPPALGTGNMPGPRADIAQLRKALQMQMGLTIERQRVPVRVMVVERAEPPTEN